MIPPGYIDRPSAAVRSGHGELTRDYRHSLWGKRIDDVNGGSRSVSRRCREGPWDWSPRGTGRTLLGFVAAVVFTTGCAHQHEALERQLASVREQLDELKRTGRSVTVRLEDVENRVLLVQDRVETGQTYLYRDRAREELPTVRLAPPGVEPVRARRTTAPEPPRAPLAYAELDPYGQVVPLGEHIDPPETMVPEPAMIAVAPATLPAPTTKPDAPSLSPREERRAAGEYKAAFGLTRKGRFEKALQRFQRFLTRYPSHPLADNALYWMAECHYAQKSYLEALQLFQRVIQEYPDGNKVPDAMLKTGLCYGNLGEVDQAKRVLRQLAVIYPGSRAARIAEERERSL